MRENGDVIPLGNNGHVIPFENNGDSPLTKKEKGILQTKVFKRALHEKGYMERNTWKFYL